MGLTKNMTMTPDTGVYQIDQVNKMAQKERHLKVFTPWFVMKKWVKGIFSALYFHVNYLKSIGVFNFHLLPIAPHKRLMSQIGLFAGALFILSGISPISSFSTISMSYATDYIDTYSLP